MPALPFPSHIYMAASDVRGTVAGHLQAVLTEGNSLAIWRVSPHDSSPSGLLCHSAHLLQRLSSTPFNDPPLPPPPLSAALCLHASSRLSDMSAGHFSASDRYKHMKEQAFEYAFVLETLGCTSLVAPAAAAAAATAACAAVGSGETSVGGGSPATAPDLPRASL